MSLNYDYDANSETWPYFVLAILVFILVPLTFQYFRKLTKNKFKEKKRKIVIPGEISEKIEVEHLKEFSSLKEHKKTKILTKKCIFLVFGWSIFLYINFFLVKKSSSESYFDPYEILGVSNLSSEKVIKSRYNALTLKFHPDKIPVTASAEYKQQMEKKYIRITQAYKSLTDKVMKQNFLKYGHPDGPQNISHGIAIPKFLIEGKYSVFMLIFYFLILGVSLPLVMGYWWNNVSNHTKKGLHINTADFFVTKINDLSSSRIITHDELLTWVCLSHEIKHITKGMILKDIKDLIYKYLNRDFDFFEENIELKKILVDVLIQIPKILRGFIDISNAFRNFELVSRSYDLLKSVIQAVPFNGDFQEILQLPYVDFKSVEKSEVRKLGHLLSLSSEKQAEVLNVHDTQKLDQILRIAAKIPELKVLDATFKVVGEKIICPLSNAFLSLRILVKSPKNKSQPKIDKSLFIENEDFEYFNNPLTINDKYPKLPESYSPFFPSRTHIDWSVFLISQSDEKIIDHHQVFTLEKMDLGNLEMSQDQWNNAKGDDICIGSFTVPFPAVTPSTEDTYHFRVSLKNNSYFGADLNFPVKMVVKKPSASDINLEHQDEKLLNSYPKSVLKLNDLDDFFSLSDESNESYSDSFFTDINTDTENEL